MKVGDLVRSIIPGTNKITDIGIIVEIDHHETAIPDYRNPPAVLVFYSRKHRDSGQFKNTIWFYKGELEMIK